MAGVLEKELKYFLNKTDYWTLRHSVSPHSDRKVSHINYYFDDPRLRLRAKRFGLRLRLVDGIQAVVTLKHPSGALESLSALKIRKEYESTIPLKQAKLIVRGKIPITDLKIMPIRVLKKHFSMEQLKKLRPLGAIKTTRIFFKTPEGVEAELDRFRMFDKRFYELEVETNRPKTADKAIRKLFKQVKIPYLPNQKSKLARFLDLWKKHQA